MIIQAQNVPNQAQNTLRHRGTQGDLSWLKKQGNRKSQDPFAG